ncbi:MAG: HAD-IB family hydrolase [Actinomycetota bacterium]|nr:HAD-IB family hydrolase [Actinomycetota bacterium]
MALALFDLDNTLLAGDSEHAWGEFLIDIGAVDEESFRAENDRLYEEYLAGTLDIYESIRFQLGPLMEHPPETLRRWQEEFMRSRIEPMITQAAVDLVEEHRGSGDDLAIITASNSFVTRPIADRFGVRELLAIELERIYGRYTGRVLGTPTFREGKVLRLQEWIESNCRTLEGSHFYSDSHNDLPLLQLVDHPVAVDPDPVLRAHAEAMGWPIVRLHDAN